MESENLEHNEKSKSEQETDENDKIDDQIGKTEGKELKSTSIVQIPTNEQIRPPTSNESESEKHGITNENERQEPFKKPILIIGPRKGKPGSIRVLASTESSQQPVDHPSSDQECPDQPPETLKSSDEHTIKEKSEKPNNSNPHCRLAYKEPSWSGKPTGNYSIEVIKSGVFIETINISEKNFYVIGRLSDCDIRLAHPTISRYHAILQYRNEDDNDNPRGFYLYDMESTHGSFWNGYRVKPKTYVRLRGGHMLKFGASERKYIIQTPPDEEEEESEESFTSLKEKRRLEMMEREERERLSQEEDEKVADLRKANEQSEGIDWGLGEDADEDSDLSENPFAMTNNEELFLDDPKKTLRGWFEREGYDLQYQADEKGIGQFICWVDLPIDAAPSGTVRAEATVKGKKKEAVIQCALEACRILDRYGLLRQATHEGRKRKSRNWEEEDYYDSDEDNFLDRTGTVERKREQRMRNAGKLESKAETYGSLMEKHLVVVKEISQIEITLKKHQDAKLKNAHDNSNVDELDAFMSNLSCAVLNKSDIVKLKMKLQGLRKDEENLRKLVNITKPADLPPLNPPQKKLENNDGKNSKIVNKSPQKKQRNEETENDNKQKINLIDSKIVDKSDGKNDECKLRPNEGRYGLIKPEAIAHPEEENNKKSVKNFTTSQETVDKFQDKEMEFSTDDQNDEMNFKKMKAVEKNNDKEHNDDDNDNNHEEDAKLREKRRKKNLKRAQQKERAKEMQKAALNVDSVYRENYSTWMPPADQTGDGKTKLNEKFGY